MSSLEPLCYRVGRKHWDQKIFLLSQRFTAAKGIWLDLIGNIMIIKYSNSLLFMVLLSEVSVNRGESWSKNI